MAFYPFSPSSGTGAQPWQFQPAAYGARGDGQIVTDGAMSTGSAVLTSASGKFTPADAGKLIQVKGAGLVNVTTLVTTIASVQSATQVTLTAANASGGNVTAALVLWATDDTAAINAASAAAQAYAAANGYAQVFSPPTGRGLYYGIGGPLLTANSTNAQIPISPVAVTGEAPMLEFAGTATGTSTHWLQQVPQVQGSTWVSFGVFASQAAQGASINNFGDPCVLGGPSYNGYGGLVSGNVLFSNMHVRIRDLNILTSHSGFGWTYSACNLIGMAKCSTENFAYSTTGLFQNGIAAGDFNTPGNFGNGFSKGFITPASGNNDVNDHRNLTCYGGYTWGLLMTEHFDGHGIRVLYCANGLAPVGTYAGASGTTTVGSTHKIRWSMASVEGCPNVLYIFGAGSSGIGPFLEGTIDTEDTVPTFTDSGANGMLDALGRVILTGLYTVADITVPATGLEVINGQQAPGPGPALTLVVGTALQLTVYRWATVTLYGGTSLTTVSVGATMGGTVAPSMKTMFSQAAGALAGVTVRVPPGGWLEVAGSGAPTAPTASVVYD